MITAATRDAKASSVTSEISSGTRVTETPARLVEYPVQTDEAKEKAMNRVLHGIVHGKMIEVSEDLGMWEGQAVDLVIVPAGSLELRAEGDRSQTTAKKLPGPPPGWKPGHPSKTAGLLADSWTEEDDRILGEIYRDRKRESRREIGI
jgi:hypothetical protein